MRKVIDGKVYDTASCRKLVTVDPEGETDLYRADDGWFFTSGPEGLHLIYDEDAINYLMASGAEHLLDELFPDGLVEGWPISMFIRND